MYLHFCLHYLHYLHYLHCLHYLHNSTFAMTRAFRHVYKPIRHSHPVHLLGATHRPSSRFPTVPVTQQILRIPNPLVIAQCRQSASIHTLCNYLIINTKRPVSVE